MNHFEHEWALIRIDYSVKYILDCYSGHAEAPGQTDASF